MHLRNCQVFNTDSVRCLPKWKRARQQMYSVKAAKELEVYPEGTGKPMMDFKQ